MMSSSSSQARADPHADCAHAWKHRYGDGAVPQPAVDGPGPVLEVGAEMPTSARRRMRIRQRHARHGIQATVSIKAAIGIPLRTSEEKH